MRVVDYVGITVFAVMMALLSWAVVSAQEAAPPAVPACDPIGMGGGRIVYRCIDEDEGKIIYLNDLGFMFALEW